MLLPEKMPTECYAVGNSYMETIDSTLSIVFIDRSWFVYVGTFFWREWTGRMGITARNLRSLDTDRRVWYLFWNNIFCDLSTIC